MICTSKKKENEARWLLELPRGTGWEPLGGSQHTSGHQQPACRIVFAKLNELPVKSSPASSTVSTFLFRYTKSFLQPIILFNYYTFANISLFCISILVQSRTGSLSVGRTVALLTSLPVHKFHQNIFSSQFFLNGSHPLPEPPSLSHSLSLSCSPTLNALS